MNRRQKNRKFFSYNFYIKNRKGFLLAEETLKIVIAVIAIGFLAYFLVSLYFSFRNSEKLEQAKETLPFLISEIDAGKTSVDIYNPVGWALLSWQPENQIPKSCSNLGWNSCICICGIPRIQTNENYRENCENPSKGICVENLKGFTVLCREEQECQVRILEPPLTLNIDQENKIIRGA